MPCGPSRSRRTRALCFPSAPCINNLQNLGFAQAKTHDLPRSASSKKTSPWFQRNACQSWQLFVFLQQANRVTETLRMKLQKIVISRIAATLDQRIIDPPDER